ncbi:YqhR family membrane protein [Bacillus kwashiorkori]|uniref:YqhR family membrane protein n=1 Tax=Bacillus kwashiorkori TaxID=1522318 RepID=UPI000785FD98|nr:YqhR family membrane protein [Bacillus kwashiorkori]
METGKLEQNQHQKPMSSKANTAITGFIGGFFWSMIGYVAYYFHFTDIRPNIVLEPWAIGAWKHSWLGVVISFFVIGIFGMVAAFLYYFLLKKFTSIWVSVGFGIALFALVFFIINPLFPSLNNFSELKRNTIITSACLYILYGVFVGYSISYEHNQHQRPGGKEKQTKSV